MKKVLFIVPFLFLVACAPIMYDSSLKGKVVDANTNAPLQGAVVLAVWNKSYMTLAGGHGEFYDAREAVVDENGKFKVPGKGLMFFTNVDSSFAYVFKAGYDWQGIDQESLSKHGGIVRLRNIMDNKKLMRDRLIGTPMPGGPHENKKLYRQEIDKARVMLGLKPSRYWNNEKQ